MQNKQFKNVAKQTKGIKINLSQIWNNAYVILVFLGHQRKAEEGVRHFCQLRRLRKQSRRPRILQLESLPTPRRDWGHQRKNREDPRHWSHPRWSLDCECVDAFLLKLIHYNWHESILDTKLLYCRKVFLWRQKRCLMRLSIKFQLSKQNFVSLDHTKLSIFICKTFSSWIHDLFSLQPLIRKHLFLTDSNLLVTRRTLPLPWNDKTHSRQNFMSHYHLKLSIFICKTFDSWINDLFSLQPIIFTF